MFMGLKRITMEIEGRPVDGIDGLKRFDSLSTAEKWVGHHDAQMDMIKKIEIIDEEGRSYLFECSGLVMECRTRLLLSEKVD